MKSLRASNSNKRIVFLVGFMGVGKSFVGRNVSSSLKWNYLDLDAVIESHTGKRITEIFNDLGEDGFREIERDTLNTIIEEYDQVVVSTGGGAPCYFDNMDIMNQFGFTIYISKTVESLANNLKKGMRKRPLLAGMQTQELLGYIRNKLAERLKYYRMAQFVIHDYHNLELTELVRKTIENHFNPGSNQST